jgi:hypothetical protein
VNFFSAPLLSRICSPIFGGMDSLSFRQLAAAEFWLGKCIFSFRTFLVQVVAPHHK